MIFLRDIVFLERDLSFDDIKPKLLGMVAIFSLLESLRACPVPKIIGLHREKSTLES